MRKFRTGNPASNRRSTTTANRLEFEALESKNLLTTIIWDNPDINANGFAAEFGANANLAVEIVEHAIEDWENYIDNFDYENVGTNGNAPVANQYNVEISADDFGAGDGTLGVTENFDVDQQLKPFFSTITLDNNGAGDGWYFDPDVETDQEFDIIENAFSAFIGGPNGQLQDLYTTVAHELGHSMGIFGHVTQDDDLMSATGLPGNRLLISDVTLNELTTVGDDGFAHDYTMFEAADFPDNVHVFVENGELQVRGLEFAVNWFEISQVGNQFHVEVNGTTERTDISIFQGLDIEGGTAGDLLIAHASFVDGANIDLGGGIDEFRFEAEADPASYGVTADANFVRYTYLLTGPNPYGFLNYENVENLVLIGTSSADSIYIGSTYASLVLTNAAQGNDVIDASNSNNENWLYGSDGNDTIYGGSGADRIVGGSGNDKMWGGTGDDYMNGVDGNDVMYGEGGNDTLHGEKGKDRLYGQDGVDVLYGGNGNDKLYGGQGNDRLYGNNGADLIHGQAGDDLIRGGKSNDTLYGNAGNDDIDGNTGSDVVHFNNTSSGNDYISATVEADGRIRIDRRLNSHTGTILETDYFTVDLLDFMWITTLGGDDDIDVDAAVGSLVDGTVDGGNGNDTAVVPGNWSTVNVEN